MADPHHIKSVLHEFPQPTRPVLSYDISPKPISPPEHETNIEYNNSRTVQQEFTREFPYPEVLELPRPSKPIIAMSGFDSCSESHPAAHDKTQNQVCDREPPPPQYYVQFSEPTQYNNHGASSSEPATSSSSDDRLHLSPSTGKTPKGEKEAVDELLLILIECMDELNTRSRESLLRKFFSEIEGEERLERFIVERLKQSRVKAITDLCENLPASIRGEMNSEAGLDALPTISETEDDDYGVTTRSIHQSVEELSHKLERFKVKTPNIGGVAQESGPRERERRQVIGTCIDPWSKRCEWTRTVYTSKNVT